MGANSNISWTDDTWNPWRGCTKVSPGCVYCYAEELVTRRMNGEWGKGKPRVQSKTTLRDPYKWNNFPLICDKCGRGWGGADASTCLETAEHKPCGGALHRRRVFSLSLGDWLDPEVPVAWLAQMLDTVRECSNLDFLLLSKRIELWRERLTAAMDAVGNDCEGEFFEADGDAELCAFIDGWLNGKPPAHVWLGASVEDQPRADERIPQLLKTPAAVRFLSVEPLLENVNLDPHWLGAGGRSGANYQQPQTDWVIVGGESGDKRRDCGVEAIVNVAEQCRAAEVPVFCKQDSHRYPGQQGRIPDEIFNLKQFPQLTPPTPS